MSRCNCFSLQLVGGRLVGRRSEPQGEVCSPGYLKGATITPSNFQLDKTAINRLRDFHLRNVEKNHANNSSQRQVKLLADSLKFESQIRAAKCCLFSDVR